MLDPSSHREIRTESSEALLGPLALPFVRTNTSSTKIHSIKLWKYKLLYQIESSSPLAPQELLSKLQSYSHNSPGFIMRGVRAQFLQEISQEDLQYFPTGSEAVIKLKNFSSTSSLSELSRRGLRRASFRELDPNEASSALESIRIRSPYSKGPFLRYLFQTTYTKDQRVFELYSDENQCSLAACSISQLGVSSKKLSPHYQVELLLRDRSAPIGSVEALLTELITQLKKENAETLSLGEAPYYLLDHLSSSRIESLYRRSRRLMSLCYSWRGLASFKDKFRPTWSPIYLCGSPTIPFSELCGLAWRCNCASLLAHRVGTAALKKLGFNQRRNS